MEQQIFDLFSQTCIGTDSVSLNIDMDDYFFLIQCQKRILSLDSDIDDESANAVVQAILRINAEDAGLPFDERVPIKLLISSDGGDVFAGFSIIDAIQASVTPVYTFNLSHQYSMATLVGMTGHKRFATKNATFLIHDGVTTIGNSAGKVQDFMKFDSQIHERMKNIVLTNSSISAKRYNQKFREEWYFFADEAKKLGVTDQIIGEDVSLDEAI